MEYETFVSGIGGQGIQLVSKMLAMAAMDAGHHVMLNGVYGGEMRGGKSLATVIMGARPLRALPVTPQASAAVVLHSNYWDEPRARLRPDALIVADAEFSANVGAAPGQVLLEVPATGLAREIGNPLVCGMILVSAFAAVTGLVDTPRLVAAMRALVPAHRAQHLTTNEQALLAGAAAVRPLSHPVHLAAGQAA